MNKIKKTQVSVLQRLRNFPWIQFLLKFRNRFNDEKILKEASSLTFVTVLGFIPFLLFVLFLLPDIPTMNLKNNLKNYIISTFLPDSANLVVNYINVIFENNYSLNIINLIMLIITSYSLFASITGVFDRILKIKTEEKITVIAMLLKFFGTLILGFMIFILLFSMSSIPYLSLIFDNTFFLSLSGFFLPVLMWFILIFLSYFFVPSNRMKAFSIVVSATVSSVLWVLMKYGFDWYITNLTRIKLLYGVISSFPIFLFWIFANWVIVLCGVILLSLMNKTEDSEGKKVKVKTITHIIIEDEKDFYIKKNQQISENDEKEIKKIIKKIKG